MSGQEGMACNWLGGPQPQPVHVHHLGCGGTEGQDAGQCMYRRCVSKEVLFYGAEAVAACGSSSAKVSEVVLYGAVVAAPVCVILDSKNKNV